MCEGVDDVLHTVRIQISAKARGRRLISQHPVIAFAGRAARTDIGRSRGAGSLALRPSFPHSDSGLAAASCSARKVDGTRGFFSVYRQTVRHGRNDDDDDVPFAQQSRARGHRTLFAAN